MTLRTAVPLLLLMGCGSNSSIVAGRGDVPGKYFDITYSIPGQAPYTVSLESGVAADQPNGGPYTIGDGRGYVLGLAGTGCPNELMFVGTPQDFHLVETEVPSGTGVLPLSAHAFSLMELAAYEVLDEQGERHEFRGGTYAATVISDDAWTVVVGDAEHCFWSSGALACQVETEPLVMEIEGEILVVPEADRLAVEPSAYFTDASTGATACEGYVMNAGFPDGL